ncbi:hypothetical protein [Marivita sp. S2033]|uniref:hypothetical protein n=1 Tax=Marivita sp. S2033 TaxID=3373187 RepID=UPI003982D099
MMVNQVLAIEIGRHALKGERGDKEYEDTAFMEYVDDESTNLTESPKVSLKCDDEKNFVRNQFSFQAAEERHSDRISHNAMSAQDPFAQIYIFGEYPTERDARGYRSDEISVGEVNAGAMIMSSSMALTADNELDVGRGEWGITRYDTNPSNKSNAPTKFYDTFVPTTDLNTDAVDEEIENAKKVELSYGVKPRPLFGGETCTSPTAALLTKRPEIVENIDAPHLFFVPDFNKAGMGGRSHSEEFVLGQKSTPEEARQIGFLQKNHEHNVRYIARSQRERHAFEIEDKSEKSQMSDRVGQSINRSDLSLSTDGRSYQVKFQALDYAGLGIIKTDKTFGRDHISVNIEAHNEVLDIKFSSGAKESLDLLMRNIADLKSDLRRIGISDYNFSFTEGNQKRERDQSHSKRSEHNIWTSEIGEGPVGSSTDEWKSGLIDVRI